jgi:hypothetical protein
MTGFLFRLADRDPRLALLFYHPVPNVQLVERYSGSMSEARLALRAEGMTVEVADRDQASWGRVILRVRGLELALR